MPIFPFLKRVFTLWCLFSFEVKAKKGTVFVWTPYCGWYIQEQTNTQSFFLLVSGSCLWKFIGNYELHAVKAGIWHFGPEIRKHLMKMCGIKTCVICLCLGFFWSCLSFWRDCFRKVCHPVLGNMRETLTYIFLLMYVCRTIWYRSR